MTTKPDDDCCGGEEDPGASLGDPVVSDAMRGEAQAAAASSMEPEPRASTIEKDVMAKRNCEIVGTVTYREGDGVAMEVPQGPCQIEVTDLDATLSWSEGESHGSAAISLQDYRRFVSEGALKMD